MKKQIIKTIVTALTAAAMVCSLTGCAGNSSGATETFNAEKSSAAENTEAAAVLRLSQCLLILSAFLFRRFLSLGLLNHSLIAAYLCVLPRVPATGLLSAFTLPGMSLSAVLRLAFSCLTLSSTL